MEARALAPCSSRVPQGGKWLLQLRQGNRAVEAAVAAAAAAAVVATVVAAAAAAAVVAAVVAAAAAAAVVATVVAAGAAAVAEVVVAVAAAAATVVFAAAAAAVVAEVVVAVAAAMAAVAVAAAAVAMATAAEAEAVGEARSDATCPTRLAASVLRLLGLLALGFRVWSWGTASGEEGGVGGGNGESTEMTNDAAHCCSELSLNTRVTA